MWRTTTGKKTKMESDREENNEGKETKTESDRDKENRGRDEERRLLDINGK